MSRTYALLPLLLLFASISLTLGCEESKEDSINVFLVEVSPERGHAPLNVQLVGDYARTEEEDFEVSWDFDDGATLRGSTTVEHLYRAPGQYEIELTVRDLSNARVGKAKRTIEVLESAGLTVPAVVARPLEVEAGTELEIAYSLRNLAAEVALPFSVTLLLTSDPNADEEDLDEASTLFKEVLDGFPGAEQDGNIQDFSRTLTLPAATPSGDYFVGVYIDSDENIGEQDEADNLLLSDTPIRVRNLSTDGPDLKVDHVDATPKRSRILSSLSVDFEISNIGFSPALDIQYRLILSDDDHLDPEDLLLTEGELAGLPTGQHAKIENLMVAVTPAIMEPGDQYLFLELDPQNQLTELNENNNLGVTTPIVITDDIILDADIVVTALELLPGATYLGGALLAQLKLINQGAESTGSFICTLYLSKDQSLEPDADELLATLNIFELAGETEILVEEAVAVPAIFEPGEYWGFVLCDSSEVVVEYDESNNLQRTPQPLSIAASAEVDLYVGAINVDGGPYPKGDPIQLSFEVCNNGETGSGPAQAAIYFAEAITASDLDFIAAEPLLPGVSPGTCEEVEIELVADCPLWTPDIFLLIALDTLDFIEETREDNNLGYANNPISIEGVGCACVTDLHEPNDYASAPSPLEDGIIEGSLCAGDSDWYAIELQPDESLVVRLTHDHKLGDLDIALFDPSLRKIARSAQPQDIEEVATYLAEETGTYLVQVGGANTSDINTYHLEVERFTPSPGIDLAVVDITLPETLESLNTPLTTQYTLLNLGHQALTSPHHVSLFLSPAGETSPAPEDERYQAIIEEMPARSMRTLEVALTLPTTLETGDFRVIGVADVLEEVQEDNEENNLHRSTPILIDTTCFDLLEPNESIATAALLNEGTYLDLKVCKDNVDYYQLHIDNGQTLTLETTGHTPDSDLDITLYDSFGAEMATSREAHSDEEIFIPVVVGEQDFILEVSQQESVYNTRAGQYDLVISSEPADPSLVCEASLEPNDDFESARRLLDASASPAPLTICPSADLDLFYVSLTAGQALDLGLSSDSGRVKASLYDQEQNYIETLYSGQTTLYYAPMTGLYYLRVYSGAGAAREEPYQLSVGGLDLADLVPSSLTLTPDTGAPGQEIQVSFQLQNAGGASAATTSASILLSKDWSPDPGDTLLAELSLPPLPQGETLELSTKTPLPLDAEGDHVVLLQIDGENHIPELNEFNNTLGETIYVDAACLPDSHEGASDNDLMLRASTLSEGIPLDATICPGDKDWYLARVTPGTTRSVHLEFSHALGDLDLLVYDDTGALLGEGKSVDDDETLSFTTTTEGLFVLVQGFTLDTQNAYTLTLE